MNDLSFKSSFPRIRFNGFDDMWQRIKLSDISVKVIEKNVKNDFDIVLTNSAEFGIIPQRDFFDKDIANLKSLNGYYVVQPNDFVYNPRISNKAPVGPIKANFLNITGVISPLYYVFRTQNIDVFFLAKYFDSSYWHKFMKLNGDTGARSDRFAIKDSVFKEMPIPFPTHPEQSAIGTLFRTLDDLLASYKDNLTNYQSLKATMLSKMFPKAGQTVPEIRLDGFEGEWELIKLGEVCDLITKGTTAKSQSEQGKVNFIKVENLKDNEIYSVVKISEEEHLGSLKRSILFEGDILFSIAGTLGRTAIVRNNVLPANTNQALAIIRGYKLDAYFLLIVLSGEVVKDYIRKNPTVGAQPNLSLEQVSSLKIQAPSIEEQRSIGLYFSNLDNLINSHQEKITQLETLKKKLLQDMFI